MKSIPLVLCALVAGCASPNSNFIPKMIAFSEPPLSQTSEKSIGETLVKQGTYSTVPGLRVIEKFSVGMISGYNFEPGYFIKEGENNKQEFFRPEPSAEGGRVSSGAISDPYKAMQVEKGTNKVCAITGFNMRVCKDNAPIERVERNVTAANSFQQALIYSGRVGNKLRIGYREFSNSVARPAFNNEVEYDLSSSNIIAYKGARLEVIDATNEKIKYRLLHNFSE